MGLFGKLWEETAMLVYDRNCQIAEMERARQEFRRLPIWRRVWLAIKNEV